MSTETAIINQLNVLKRDVADLHRREIPRRIQTTAPVSGIRVLDYGAVADAHRVRDVGMTAGGPGLYSASALFEPSDVGLVIGVEGAGAGGAPLVTTIASYESPSIVYLATNCLTTIDGKVASWGTNNTAAFQAAINAAALLPGSTSYSDRTTGAGGGTAFVQDGSYLVGSIIFPNRTGLVGASERATLYMLPGMTQPLITNVSQAQRIILDTFSVIGNREIQTTKVSGIFLYNLYAHESANEIIDYTRQEEADMRPVIRNIYMDHMPGKGIHVQGRGDGQISGCLVYRSTEHGFVIAMDDAYVTNCVAAMTEGTGFYVARGGAHYTGLKAWYAGGVPNDPKYLYDLNGTLVLDENSNPVLVPGIYIAGYGGEMAGVEVQDALGAGLYLNFAERWVIQGFQADSNGRATGSAEPNVRLHVAHDNVITGLASYRFLNTDGTFSYAQNQTAHALRITGGSQRNSIQLATRDHASTPLDPASTAIKGNTITLGNQNGTQSILSYNQPATPSPQVRPVNPYAGSTISVDLLNDVVLAAPSPAHLGMRLTFVFTQSGTIGHRVTWNAAYKTTWQPTAALGSISTISFVYDGAVWLPESADLPIGGGGNLIINGSFEHTTPLTNWEVYPTGTVTTTTPALASGSGVPHGANVFQQAVAANGASFASVYSSGFIEIDRNHPVTLTMWARRTTSAAATTTILRLECYNAAGASVGNVYPRGLIPGATAPTFESLNLSDVWTWYGGFIASPDWPATTIKIKVVLFPTFQPTGGGTTTVQIDAIQLVRGVYAGTFAPRIHEVGPQQPAVTAGVNAVAAPTKAEFDALVAVVNTLRARLTAHGLTA